MAGLSVLAMGAPGSGKSTLARQALVAEGSGLVALAPGLNELASYERWTKDTEKYRIKGFDDPEFYPMAGSMVATGYDDLLKWLRGIYVGLKKEVEEGKPPRFQVLVTDTFNDMSVLAMNKTLSHLNTEMPPPAMSPTGAAFWGYQRNLLDALMRACRSIRGLGLHWVCTCHVAEKELKETAMANPDAVEGVKGKMGIVPAISGGFRDVMAGGFDIVLHTGVMRPDKNKPPVHYLQWMPSDKRPTKSRYGGLAEQGRIAADWIKLRERVTAVESVL